MKWQNLNKCVWLHYSDDEGDPDDEDDDSENDDADSENDDAASDECSEENEEYSEIVKENGITSKDSPERPHSQVRWHKTHNKHIFEKQTTFPFE